MAMTSSILSSIFIATFCWPSLYAAAAAGYCFDSTTLGNELGEKLSIGSSLTEVKLQRWSAYGAPQPRFVVNVASEKDVSTTVKFCNQWGLTFLAQNGGNGWANTFDLDDCGVVINIENLNNITIAANKTQATIGGGSRVHSMVDAGYAADVRFATTSCNCLGFLGSALGGGQARTMGLYGMSVDQLISMNVVTAWGALIAVDPSNDDLWWALKGAAPNFGIVTSATVKAYAVPQAQNVVWTGTIVFADDRLEEFISIINDLYLQPEMQIHFLFSSAANGSTSITAIPFYIGSTAEGRQAFKSILDIGYISDTTAELPYPQWNEVADPFCSRGGRKPGYGVSMNNLDPQEWRSVYEDFKGLIKRYPFARKSIILAENYPVNSTAVQNGAGSYPFRSVKTHAVALPWYANASFDSTANQWGEQVRSALRSTDGLQHNANYINFAHGDETLKDIYGESLPRLQALKKQYDPLNRFNQWFPIV